MILLFKASACSPSNVINLSLSEASKLFLLTILSIFSVLSPIKFDI